MIYFRNLQRKLEKPDSNSPPPRALTLSDFDQGGDTAANLVTYFRLLFITFISNLSLDWPFCAVKKLLKENAKYSLYVKSEIVHLL